MASPALHPAGWSLSGRPVMIAADARPKGVHPRSETADQASAAPRQLIIEWITRL